MRSKLADAQLRERVERAVARVMNPSPECAAVVESVVTALEGVPGLAAAVGAAVHMNRDLPAPAELEVLRTRRGLTRQQVAEIVGVTAAAVAQWERGVCTPKRGTTERVRYLNLVDLMIRETADA